MPSASRNERKKHRIRRNLTLAKRMLHQQAIGRLQALGALFTILSNHGGQIEVTEEQLVNGTNLLKNGRLTIEKQESGTFLIRLATADEVESANTPAFVPDPSLVEPVEGTPDEVVTLEGEDVVVLEHKTAEV